MRQLIPASTAGGPSGRRIVLRVGACNTIVPVGAAFAAASLIAGASSATYASSVSPDRLGSMGSRVAFVARDEDVGVSVADALAEIKRKAGLTWDNLARIFGVSRRTVHNWVNGEAVKVLHADRVQTLLERIRAAGDMRAFQLGRAVLAEQGVSERLAPATVAEPPILVSDPRPFKHNVAVRRGGTTRVVRSRYNRGQ